MPEDYKALDRRTQDRKRTKLLDSKGLPGRPWYQNLVYAPGRFTGYGAKTLPGVREAIEERRFADANTYAELTADALNAYAARLDTAAEIIGK